MRRLSPKEVLRIFLYCLGKVASSSGSDVPQEPVSLAPVLIPKQEEDGDGKRQHLCAGDAEPYAVQTKVPWKQPKEQKEQEEGAQRGDQPCPVSLPVGGEPDCGKDIPAAEQKAQPIEAKPPDT